MNKTRMKNINDYILIEIERKIKDKLHEQRQANKDHDFNSACLCELELIQLMEQYEDVEQRLLIV